MFPSLLLLLPLAAAVATVPAAAATRNVAPTLAVSLAVAAPATSDVHNDQDNGDESNDVTTKRGATCVTEYWHLKSGLPTLKAKLR